MEAAGILVGRHLAQDQFCTTQGQRVGHGGGVVVTRTPVSPNSNSAEFCASVMLYHCSCGVKIELALESLAYPGNYLGFPISESYMRKAITVFDPILLEKL